MLRDWLCRRCATLWLLAVQTRGCKRRNIARDVTLHLRDLGQLALVVRAPEFGAIGGADQIGLHAMVSPCCVIRPISTAPTCSSLPIFCGSSSLPLNRKTVLRAITFVSGSRERELIRLSVRPSLRYSLLASAVEFTNGSTAIESILPALAPDLPRKKIHSRPDRDD